MVRVVYCGRELRHTGATFRDYGIVSDNTLQVIPRVDSPLGYDVVEKMETAFGAMSWMIDDLLRL